MAGFILQGISALAWALKMRVPSKAESFIKKVKPEAEELRDILIAFALPQVEAVRALFVDDKADSGPLAVEMVSLLSKWSALYIQ